MRIDKGKTCWTMGIATALTIGLAWVWWWRHGSGQEAVDAKDMVNRPVPTVASLLWDLKKYRVLHGPSDKVKETHQALVAMGAAAVGPVSEAIRDKARYGVYERGDLLAVLVEIGDPAGTDAILDTLADPQGPSFYDIGPSLEKALGGRIEPILKMLESPEAAVHHRAFSVFFFVHDRRALEPLVRLLRDNPEPRTQGVAASVLGGLGDRRAVEPLIAAMRTADENAVGYMATALGRLGDTRAVEPLLEILRRDPPKWAKHVVEPLGELRDQRAVEPLLTLLDSPTDLSSQVCKALGKIGGPKATAAILRELKAYAGKTGSQLAQAAVDRSHLYALQDAMSALAPAAFEQLLAELNDKNSAFRLDAARYLGAAGDRRAVEPLIAMAEHEKADWELVKWAVHALGQLRDRRAIPVLVEALDRNDALTAAGALAWLDPPAIEELIDALGHKRWDVRTAVARVLAARGEPGWLEPLIKLFPEVDPRTSETGGGLACPPVRCFTLQLVAKAGGPEHVPFLVEALKDPFEDVRREAVRALSRLGDERAVPALIEELRSPPSRYGFTRHEVARALGNIRDARAVRPLIEAMATYSDEIVSGHGDGPPGVGGPFTRRRTFWETNDFEKALIQIGGPSVKPLLPEVNGPRENVRCGAIRVLGQLRDRRAVKPLIRALGDRDTEIRSLAIAALGEIGDPRAVEPLMEIAVTRSDPIWVVAGDALWTLGPEAVDPLVVALGHENPLVCRQAASALKAIADPRGLKAIAARGIEPDRVPSGAGKR